MKNNPFSKNTNVADVESTLNTKVKNPFIEIKENEDLKKVKKKRKSILFSIDDYNKIVALSKTNGMSIVGIVNELVDASIENLSDIDRNRYDLFIKGVAIHCIQNIQCIIYIFCIQRVIYIYLKNLW